MAGKDSTPSKLMNLLSEEMEKDSRFPRIRGRKNELTGEISLLPAFIYFTKIFFPQAVCKPRISTK